MTAKRHCSQCGAPLRLEEVQEQYRPPVTGDYCPYCGNDTLSYTHEVTSHNGRCLNNWIVTDSNGKEKQVTCNGNWVTVREDKDSRKVYQECGGKVVEEEVDGKLKRMHVGGCGAHRWLRREDLEVIT